MVARTYAQMSDHLKKFLTPPIHAVSNKLTEIAVAAEVCAAVAKVYPKDSRRRLKPLSLETDRYLIKQNRDGGSPLSESIARVIDKHLFPLDEFIDDIDYGEDPQVLIRLSQYKISLDEFSDIVSGDPAELSDHLGFPIMAFILGGWYDDGEQNKYWEACNKRFSWGVPEFPDLPSYKEFYIDGTVLKRELRKRGVRPLYTLFNALDGSTGNYFFDLDYENGDMPPYMDYPTLLALHKEWKKSLAIEVECNLAFDLLQSDPKIYIKFLDAYKASHRRRKE